MKYSTLVQVLLAGAVWADESLEEKSYIGKCSVL